MNKDGKTYRGAPSICWDCENSTNPEVCPWARDLTPVKGWDATPIRLGNAMPMDTYIVRSCPLFHRDSYGGGSEWSLMRNRPKTPRLYDDDLRNLAEAIIEGAVDDWKALQYGAIETIQFRGNRITKKDTLEFFFSKDFEDLLGTFSERTPKQIRSWIKITDDMRPREVKVLKTWQTMKFTGF